MTRNIARGQRVSPEKSEVARRLRKQMTPAEILLWSMMRRKKFNGRRFRRQQIIEGFVVDFFCPQLGLIVEVDGEIHQFTREHDEARDEVLRSLGLHVVRFTNDQVLQQPDLVATRLEELTQ